MSEITTRNIFLGLLQGTDWRHSNKLINNYVNWTLSNDSQQPGKPRPA